MGFFYFKNITSTLRPIINLISKLIDSKRILYCMKFHTSTLIKPQKGTKKVFGQILLLMNLRSTNSLFGNRF